MTDTTNIIKCPACGKEMKKVYLFEKGINVDICTSGCGGIYFDNQELQQFNQEHDTDEIEQHYKGLTFTPTDQSQNRICPCKTQMAKHNAPGGVQVDTCYNCGGVFLDYGELDMILNYASRSKPNPKPKPQTMPAENMDMDTLKKFYREAQDEERLQEYVYSKGFGRRRSIFSLLWGISRWL